MKRSKKQRRERIYEMRNLKKKTAQNKQHTARHTAAVMTDKIKQRWQQAEKMIKTKTTTIMTTTAAIMTAVTNWVKKFLHLNRISKEIRIRIKIKSIYNEATCFLSTHLIKKEINKQKAAINRFKLQSVYNRFFAVQWVHKMYFMICTHNSFIFTQQLYLNRIVCSALKIICVVFFNLIFFLCMYQERFFFFFFFLIDLKEITICNISTDLMKQWEFNSDDKANMMTAVRKEV